MSDTYARGSGPLEPHFQFKVGDVLLLCEAERVEAVTAYQAPTPLPRVPPHLLGLVNYDQRALVLVDLARFLSVPRSEEDPTRTLVVQGGGYRVGLPVDLALGVVTLEESDVRHGSQVFGGRLAEFVRAEADTPNGLGAVLDLELLLEAARV